MSKNLHNTEEIVSKAHKHEHEHEHETKHEHEHETKCHHHHGLHHHHDHDHWHIDNNQKSLNWKYRFAITINLLFVMIEAFMGFKSNSLGLLSDAGHNLSDVFSLILAMVAFKLATTKSTKRFTYGYKKTSVLISLFNASLLLIAIGAIILESIRKFTMLDSLIVNGSAITITAGIGILVNGLTVIILMKDQKHDINTRGAYLHMLTDTLVSVGVLVSGVVIAYTGWAVIDPIISILIASIILISTWNLLKQSFRMSIDAVPEKINPDEIYNLMKEHENVIDVHHIHIWAISTTEIALTAHLVIESIENMEQTQESIKHILSEKGISHSTIELETKNSHCPDRSSTPSTCNAFGISKE